jgi:hypothetical protein
MTPHQHARRALFSVRSEGPLQPLHRSGRAATGSDHPSISAARVPDRATRRGRNPIDRTRASANQRNPASASRRTTRRIFIVCVLCLTALPASAWDATAIARPADTERPNARPDHAGRTYTRSRARGTVRIASARRRSDRGRDRLAMNTLAATSGVFLFGDQTVEGHDDYNAAGVAEAFPIYDSTSGTAQAISVYVESDNSASTMVAGLYADTAGVRGR